MTTPSLPHKQISILIVFVVLLLCTYSGLNLRYSFDGHDVPSGLAETDRQSLKESPKVVGQASKGEEKADGDTLLAKLVQGIHDAVAFGGSPDDLNQDPATFPLISELDYSQSILESPYKEYPYAIIMARTPAEDIDWIDDALGHDPLLTKAIYNVENPQHPYTIPTNKGREVMAYLTYIIYFYASLPPINIFMHAHDNAWHNNWLLNSSNAQTLRNLNHKKVMRDGYMNLRCQIDGDCPGHIFPIAKNHTQGTIWEERNFARAFSEILPGEPIPEVVSQACCGQFAVTSQRIRLLPRAQYVHFRRWLMDTRLTDHLCGRIWEYIYQYIWAGKAEFCPSVSVCLCDGFGICFGGEERYEVVRGWYKEIGKAREEGDGVRVEVLEGFIDEERERAVETGRDERSRAGEVGRMGWVEGDGI